MEVTALFIIGFLGSLHCIGMCGPIVLALPSAPEKDFIKKLLYNAGRIFTYAVLGLGAGYLGSRFFISGLQQYLSIIIGACIIIYVLLPFRWKAGISSIKIYSFLNKPVKKGMGKLFKKTSTSSFILIGLLNGLLPCGFVYMALASSALTGTPLKGAAAMTFFGLGALPAMLSFSVIAKFLSNTVRSRIKKVIPAFALLLGIIILLRGSNLGIPYISPKVPIQSQISTSADCCK